MAQEQEAEPANSLPKLLRKKNQKLYKEYRKKRRINSYQNTLFQHAQPARWWHRGLGEGRGRVSVVWMFRSG